MLYQLRNQVLKVLFLIKFSAISAPKKTHQMRRALDWKALKDMARKWISTMSIELKRQLFVAIIESILWLYGCEAWTLRNAMEKALGGSHTRMLRKVLNVHWSEIMINVTLYVASSSRNPHMGNGTEDDHDKHMSSI